MAHPLKMKRTRVRIPLLNSSLGVRIAPAVEGKGLKVSGIIAGKSVEAFNRDPSRSKESVRVGDRILQINRSIDIQELAYSEAQVLLLRECESKSEIELTLLQTEAEVEEEKDEKAQDRQEEDSLARSRKRALRALSGFVFMDMLGVGLVIPSLPAISEAVGGTATGYGLIQMMYGLGQLLGSPISGFLSDRYGRRVVLLASFIGSCLAYSGVGFSTSLASLMAFRLAVGLVKQTSTVATAYVSDVTDWRSRVPALGRLQSSTFFGFMLGPILGSVLAMRMSTRTPFFVAGGIFALLSLLGFLWLPDPGVLAIRSSSQSGVGPSSSTSSPSAEMDPEVEELGEALRCPFNPSATGPNPHVKPRGPEGAGRADSLSRVLSDLRDLSRERPLLLRVLLVRALSQASYLLIQSVMLLHLNRQYQLTRRSNGFFLGYNGLLGILVNIFLVGRISNWLRGEMRSVTFGCIAGGLGAIWGGYAPNFVWYCVSNILLALGVNTQRTASTSLFTQLCPADARGTYLGYSDGLDALSRVLMPLLGGFLLDYKSASPFVLAGAAQILIGVAWDAATRRYLQTQKSQKTKKE